MASRIVLFGATGYTGQLVAEALARYKVKPVLAARNKEVLTEIALELGGMETAVADVDEPESLRGLVGAGDVLVSTVGPFERYGQAVIEEAIAAGAHYFDSTGEPAFIREVFETYGPAATKQGCGLLTAFGYDFVPGNLGGALALERAGERASRVDVGYFLRGKDAGWSGGTQASGVGIVSAPGFRWRDGELHTERGARRARKFQIGEGNRVGFSIAGSEHLTLPRLTRKLREVNVYLGWFARYSRAIQATSAVGSVAFRVPGARRAFQAVGGRMLRGSTGGPDAEARAESLSEMVAIAYDDAGAPLTEVRVTGVNPYTFTGDILAWGAVQAANGRLRGTGALGPVDAFGLAELRSGCEEAGLSASFPPSQ
jgi:short subunit dehydrogenase-like uncharacterized protein